MIEIMGRVSELPNWTRFAFCTEILITTQSPATHLERFSTGAPHMATRTCTILKN